MRRRGPRRATSVKVEMPMCVKCGRVVDRLTQERDLQGEAIIFKAYCHGVVEETWLSQTILVEGDIVALRQGKAFGEVQHVDMKV